ncbi:MAG TPA: TonB-dependent receptor plug domain-containing protein, partial [Vicinamibacterales bacterium]
MKQRFVLALMAILVVVPVRSVFAQETTGTLTSDQLQNVPVGRTVSDALYLAPGVSSSSTAGRANPSIAGGTGLENQFVIDGANVTNMASGSEPGSREDLGFRARSRL